MNSSRFVARALRSSSRQTTHPSQSRSLYLHATRPLSLKKDDLQDRTSLNPQSTEYSKSGGDAEAAQESEAFDPQKTDPQRQHEEGSNRKGGDSENPLNVSPANQEVNKAPAEGVDKSPNAAQNTRKTSGGGSPRKDGGA